MGIFTKDFTQQARARIQEKRAMQTAVKNNPNATARDYAQAGMNPFNMMVAKAKAAKAAGTAQPAKPFTPGFGRNATLDRTAANIFGGSIGNQTAANGIGQSGFARMAQNAVANRAAAQINPMQPTPISPTAFTNQDAIGGMFGAANDGTFTRTVGDTPIMQMADPGYMDPMSDVDPGIVSSEPMLPPIGVDQSITPTYDLSNQQL